MDFFNKTAQDDTDAASVAAEDDGMKAFLQADERGILEKVPERGIKRGILEEAPKVGFRP